MQYLALINVYIDSFDFAYCIVLSFKTHENLMLNIDGRWQGKKSIIEKYLIISKKISIAQQYKIYYQKSNIFL